MDLQLDYAFIPSPYPIHASETGGNPAVIDLDVLIDNPTGLSVSLTMIKIKIPTGSDSADNLSVASLPAPVYDPGVCTITSNGSIITLVPVSGSSFIVGEGNIRFTLPGITVNHVAGTVPITVEEYSPSGGSATDDHTYQLIKQPTDYPVSNFRAVPPSLNNINQPVTIYWDGSSDVVYDLTADVLPNRDCIDTGTCYSATDGTAGVMTSPLENVGDYRITLDVIQPNANGTRTLLDSLTLTVSVQTPTIVDNSYAAPPIVYNGQLVFLHYIALNSASVTVLVDNVVYDSNAPLNTYDAGYPVIISTQAASSTITLLAYSADKTAQDSRQYSIQIQPSNRIDLSSLLPQNMSSVFAVLPVPNSTLILLCDLVSSMLIAVDQQKLTVVNTFALNISQMSSYAITADGQYGLFAETVESNARTFVFNITNWALEPDKQITTDNFVAQLVAPPSGGVVWGLMEGGVIIKIDPSTWTVSPVYTLPTTSIQSAIACTPDGQYVIALVSVDALYVFDVKSGSDKPVTSLSTGMAWKGAPAITPDGKTMLVAVMESSNQESTLLIDLTTLPTINTANAPSINQMAAVEIAFTQDSTRALFIYGGFGTVVLSLYDLTRQMLVGSSSTSQSFLGTAAALADGRLFLAAMEEPVIAGDHPRSIQKFLLVCGAYALPTSV